MPSASSETARPLVLARPRTSAGAPTYVSASWPGPGVRRPATAAPTLVSRGVVFADLLSLLRQPFRQPTGHLPMPLAVIGARRILALMLVIAPAHVIGACLFWISWIASASWRQTCWTHAASWRYRPLGRPGEHTRAVWRRGRDSNPRWACAHTHFPGVLLQPLGHLSEGGGVPALPRHPIPMLPLLPSGPDGVHTDFVAGDRYGRHRAGSLTLSAPRIRLEIVALDQTSMYGEDPAGAGAKPYSSQTATPRPFWSFPTAPPPSCSPVSLRRSISTRCPSSACTAFM